MPLCRATLSSSGEMAEPAGCGPAKKVAPCPSARRPGRLERLGLLDLAQQVEHVAVLVVEFVDKSDAFQRRS